MFYSTFALLTCPVSYGYAVVRLCGCTVIRFYGYKEVTISLHKYPQNLITVKPYNRKIA